MVRITDEIIKPIGLREITAYLNDDGRYSESWQRVSRPRTLSSIHQEAVDESFPTAPSYCLTPIFHPESVVGTANAKGIPKFGVVDD